MLNPHTIEVLFIHLISELEQLPKKLDLVKIFFISFFIYKKNLYYKIIYTRKIKLTNSIH